MFLGIAAATGFGLVSLWLWPTDEVLLHSLTPKAQQQFYMSFLRPGPLDFPSVTKETAVNLAEKAEPRNPVTEVVLARAHRVQSGPEGNPLCWVVVMTFGQKPPVEAPYLLVLVDAHSGGIILQGGAMAGP